MRGVQTFWYRGGERASLAGQVIVLHPDEVHDGGAGTEAGLIYRMLYIEPTLIGQALGDGAELPFVADPVVGDPGLRAALLRTLGKLDSEIDCLAVDQLVAELVEGLTRHARAPRPRNAPIAVDALRRSRGFLDASISETVTSTDLEAISGLDRFTLTRQFKSAFGTSPHRYLVMRRLGRGRQLLTDGLAIAEAAMAAGFGDQSHFHRQFAKAYGMTPGQWRRLTQRQASIGRQARSGAETGWQPTRTVLLAGALRYSEYDDFREQIIQHLILKGREITVSTGDHELTDWDDLSLRLPGRIRIGRASPAPVFERD